MEGEKKKVVLIYVLMLLVIVLIVALTLVVLNNTPKKENSTSLPSTTPKVDVNPYPNISDQCTFDLTLDEYNALTGPKCKNGYSRYNISNIQIGGQTIPVTVIYTDLDGNKAGLYVKDKRATTKMDNVTNVKFGIFAEKLFVLDTNNNESNVLVYSKESLKLYDLKETLESLKITDPAFTNLNDSTISSKTIDPASFNFSNTEFTFKTQTIDSSNQIISGSTYKVTFNEDKFNNPEFVNMN